MEKRTITKVTADNSSGAKLPNGILPKFASLIKRVVRDQGLGARDKGETQISLSFVDDNVIRQLNKKYRKLDRSTDVLSFEMHEDGVLGDIIISVDAAKRNAKRFDVSLGEELTRLVIHGLLHLMGHDHVREAQRRTMRKLEEGYLSKFYRRSPC